MNYGSSQDDIDSVTGAPHRASSKAGAHTGVGAGLWFLSSLDHTAFLQVPEQHRQAAETHRTPDPTRAVLSPRARPEVSLWVQQLVTVVSKDPLSKPIICIYRHPLRGDVLWEKKVSHKTFGLREQAMTKVFSV